MTYDDEFYTIAYLKAFSKSADMYAERESAYLWRITAESSVSEANSCYMRLNNEAALIAARSNEAQTSKIGS